MSLKEKLNSDLKESLKAGDNFRTGVLRMILSSVQNKEIENKGKGKESKLSDEEIVEVLFRETKKRKEASETYSSAGREELAQKEIKELNIVKSYLPTQASRQEIEKIVEEAIRKTSAAAQKDFGKVMGEAMKELKGKAESSAISEIIKNKLSNFVK